MAKKKKTGNGIFKNLFYVIGILFFLLLFLFFLNILGVVNISFLNIDLAGLFGGLGLNITLPPTNYQPPEGDDCTDYNLGQQFRYAYGNPAIDGFRTTCNSLGGIWTERNNEIGCYWNPAMGGIDCNDATVQVFENFCENGLLANWVCNNGIAYVGCLCNRNPPDPFVDEGDDTPPEGDGEFEYPLGTIFVTNTVYSGPLGRLAGADAKCMFAVTYSDLDLPGNWKAIISDESTSANSRTPNGPYYRVDGVLIANTKAELFSGSLSNPVNLNEHGTTPAGTTLSWTGSFGDGAIMSGHTCNDWGFVDAIGMTGLWTSTGTNWMEEIPFDCSHSKHLYCVRVS